jgi:hypothetical protein
MFNTFFHFSICQPGALAVYLGVPLKLHFVILSAAKNPDLLKLQILRFSPDDKTPQLKSSSRKPKPL